MRAALSLLVLFILIVWAAMNTAVLIDNIIALATGPLFDRQSAWIGWLLILLVIAAVALVLASRRAYRQLDRDFPNTFDN